MFIVFEEDGGTMGDSADRLCAQTPDSVAGLHAAVQAR